MSSSKGWFFALAAKAHNVRNPAIFAANTE
jgi:hypothetical protein